MIRLSRMNEGFFRRAWYFSLNGGKFFLLLGEGLTGFSKRLCLLVGLGGQGVQAGFLLPLDFELGNGQVFFGAATLTALSSGYTRQSAYSGRNRLAGCCLRLLQDWLAVLLKDRLSGIVQQGFGCPLLAPADLHDSLLDCADQSLIFAAFRPEDYCFSTTGT